MTRLTQQRTTWDAAKSFRNVNEGAVWDQPVIQCSRRSVHETAYLWYSNYQARGRSVGNKEDCCPRDAAGMHASGCAQGVCRCTGRIIGPVTSWVMLIHLFKMDHQLFWLMTWEKCSKSRVFASAKEACIPSSASQTICHAPLEYPGVFDSAGIGWEFNPPRSNVGGLARRNRNGMSHFTLLGLSWNLTLMPKSQSLDL